MARLAAPFAALVLPPHTARALLAVVWTGAVLAIAVRMLWLHAPRWLYVPLEGYGLTSTLSAVRVSIAL
ncbi:MAG: hypothetical protein M3O55_01945 [Actinomycetota bacterium]|nr:hypothetical protein [Actinomycetota bacterium]